MKLHVILDMTDLDRDSEVYDETVELSKVYEISQDMLGYWVIKGSNNDNVPIVYYATWFEIVG